MAHPNPPSMDHNFCDTTGPSKLCPKRSQFLPLEVAVDVGSKQRVPRGVLVTRMNLAQREDSLRVALRVRISPKQFEVRLSVEYGIPIGYSDLSQRLG